MSQTITHTAAQSHVVVTDPEFNIRFVSEGFCDMLACESDGLVGQSLAQWLIGAEESGTGVNTVDDLADHASFSRVLSLRGADGREHRFDFKLVPVAGPDGERTIYMAVGGPRVSGYVNDYAAARRFELAYGGSSLTFERGQEYYHELERHMSEVLVYRDPNLTVGAVARKLGTNTQYLSQVVNFFAGTRFSSYVNNRRLESMAVRLAAGEKLDANTAWAEAGFGSYSAFYRALRRHYGVRPAAFFS